ncbi:MAG: hypothetical protein ACTSYD_11845 [Candidatus Heimdallarchaeaceae archaeon]
MGLAIDIDETLAQTNLLWARHHLEAYGSPESLSAEDIIKKYRFVKNVPYWQFDAAYRWVEEHINSNESKLEIPVIEESIKVMQKIPVACYLTNRPESTKDGTKRWLQKYGFPEREIISSARGLEWKAQKLAEMFPEVTGIVDDNFDLLTYVPYNYKGRIFLYSHSNHITSKLDVILCPTWADVEKEVQRLI